jgi:hypothetical protein
VLLAGNGGDAAAVVYARAPGGAGDRPPGAPCGLALLDLRTGAVDAASPVCAPGELPAGLALERTAGGPVAYLALWHRATPAGAAPAGTPFLPAGARIRRLAARIGAPLGETPTNGLPRPAEAGGSLLLAPGPGGREHPALFYVEALPGSRLGAWGAAEYGWQFVLSARWRLLRLTPETLEPESELGLAFAPSGLAVAPDGATAYAFDAVGDGLVGVDLATGQTGEVARVPGHRPWGLAATADRLYVASPPDGRVWALDRATGRRVLAFGAGLAPAAIAPAP